MTDLNSKVIIRRCPDCSSTVRFDLNTLDGLMNHIMENYDIVEFIEMLSEHAELNSQGSSSSDEEEEELKVQIDSDGFYSLAME